MDGNLAMGNHIVDGKQGDHEPYLITEDDVKACWSPYSDSYLADILNLQFDVLTARGDLLSLIGSKYDPRSKTEAE